MDNFDWEILKESHLSLLQHFDCGEPDVNFFLKENALKWQNEGYNTCHLLLDNQKKELLGFITLSPRSFDKRCFSPKKREGKPLEIPVILLGMMGVDKAHKGKGIANRLLSRAIYKVYEYHQEIGCTRIIVEALNQKSEDFFVYQEFDILEKKEGKKTKLLLSIKDIMELMK